jgi:hypothetical protein
MLKATEIKEIKVNKEKELSHGKIHPHLHSDYCTVEPGPVGQE